jgi:hypothetical protein
MTIFTKIHPVHLTFFIIFGITASICFLFIVVKMSRKKRPKQLEKERFDATISPVMKEIAATDDAIFNFWPYVSELKLAKILSNKIKENELVYNVYRDANEQFEHILLATENENNYVSLIVNRNKKKIIGYSVVDSHGHYVLT